MMQWYVLRSKPRKEQSLYRYILAEGVACFYPQLEVEPVNPRSAKVRAYFPGYMFAQVDLEAVGNNYFRWMPFSLGLVEFGGEPAVVSDTLILGLKRRIDEINGNKSIQLAGFHPGEIVRIMEGPFEGYEAIFDTCLSGQDRVRVLLKLLNDSKHLPLELHSGQLRLTAEA